MRPSEGAGLSVARYLRPEEAVVPFRARPELDELLDWCTSGAHAAARLVTGDGGAGKTRLALRLGEELAASGWQPLWVPRDSERDAVEAVHVIGQPCVLMVDYAETRSGLVGMLDPLATDQGGPDLSFYYRPWALGLSGQAGYGSAHQYGQLTMYKELDFLEPGPVYK